MVFASIFFFFSLFSHGQEVLGFKLPEERKSVTIPFRLVNNLVVIPVIVNNGLTLNFILDSGASTPILTERVFGDFLGLEYTRTISISGPGVIDSINAYVANNVTMSLPNGVKGENMSLLVLEEDYINLKKNLGEDIFGIIGYDVFSRFVVQFDYDELEITLTDPAEFKRPRKYREIDMNLENTKPYIETVVKQNEKLDTLKMMVDTGASHGLLLDVSMSETLTYPDSTLNTTLGHGLGGEIPGKIGRFQKVEMDKYFLNEMLVSIPDIGAYSNAIKRGSRNGTIGGDALSHFNVIFDYKHEKLYLRKGEDYKKPFEYDMSGLRIALMENPDRFTIETVLEDSPADKAGLKRGMVIKSINHRSVSNSNLTSIYSLLKSKPGKRIKVKVYNEEGEVVKFKFRLRRLI